MLCFVSLFCFAKSESSWEVRNEGARGGSAKDVGSFVDCRFCVRRFSFLWSGWIPFCPCHCKYFMFGRIWCLFWQGNHSRYGCEEEDSWEAKEIVSSGGLSWFLFSFCRCRYCCVLLIFGPVVDNRCLCFCCLLLFAAKKKELQRNAIIMEVMRQHSKYCYNIVCAKKLKNIVVRFCLIFVRFFVFFSLQGRESDGFDVAIGDCGNENVCVWLIVVYFNDTVIASFVDSWFGMCRPGCNFFFYRITTQVETNATNATAAKEKRYVLLIVICFVCFCLFCFRFCLFFVFVFCCSKNGHEPNESRRFF